MSRAAKLFTLVAAATVVASLPSLAHAATDAVTVVSPDAHGDHPGIAWSFFKKATPEDSRTGVSILMMNFIIFLGVLNFLLFKPLRAKHAANRLGIVEALGKAEQATTNAEAALTDYKTKVSGLESEVSEILRTAEERAQREAAEILEAAEVQAKKILESAQATVERETAARVRAIESEVVDLALDRAETMLREKFGAADQQTAVTSYVGEIAGADLGGTTR